MTLEGLIVAALDSCPWVPWPLPPVELLPRWAYEIMEAFHGFSGKRGMTMWEEELGVVVSGSPRIYLREGATPGDLCHEYRHAVEGRWHP